VAGGDVAQVPLGLVDLPLAREDAGLHVRVRVPEHDLLHVPAQPDELAVRRLGQQPVHDLSGVAELLERLEQRREPDVRVRVVPEQAHEPGLAGQERGGQDVVLLVCRSNAAGLRTAQLAAIEYGSGALPGSLAGLVVMADAPGRLPKALTDQLRLVAGAVPHLWQMPWVEGWRLTETPDPAALPPAARSVLDKIRLHTAAGT
jgi:hypothetical protein